MTGPVLYHAGGAVTLVGAGPVPPARLAAALALAPEAVAADGGGNLALPVGTSFRAVIGDLDSIAEPDRLRADGTAVHAVAEQDTTDLEKCLYSVEAPLYLGVGFLGGRIDHHLAAMTALVRYPDRRVVLVGAEDLCFLAPDRFEIALAAGTRVSLYPMARVTGQLSEGLRWSVAGLALAPDGRIGTSNQATGGTVRFGFDRRQVLAILPAGELANVAGRLTG